jgi:hypothetical protein
MEPVVERREDTQIEMAGYPWGYKPQWSPLVTGGSTKKPVMVVRIDWRLQWSPP